MEKEIISNSKKETQGLGERLAEEILAGTANLRVVCLSGDLGAGKTTFTQGFLSGLGVEGPYTSPTFVIMKQYETKTKKVYHIDAYRVGPDDILNLGWEEIISDKKSIVVVEWADRVEKILPEGAVRIQLEWIDENKRKINISN